MIEYRLVLYKDYPTKYHNWSKVVPPVVPLRSDFKTVYFRIDSVVYTEWTAEFEAAITWDILQNDAVQSQK